MNQDELLRAAAQLHHDWAIRNSARVPVDQSMSNPHDGIRSDLNEHHLDVCAPPEVDDELNQRLVELLAQVGQAEKTDWNPDLHPRDPGGRFVHGWSSHNRSDLVDETAKKVFDEARANPEAAGWSDADLMAAARDQAELDVSQSVKRELRHGGHRISFETDISDEDVHRTAATVNRLMKERPVEKLRLTVMSDSRLPAHSHGETYRGGGIIRISDAAYRQDSADVASFMPSRREHSNLDYVLAHEWGHTHDVHSEGDPVMIYEHFADLSPYGQTSPAEAYAEAYADWTLTGGNSTNPATRAYAQKYGWEATTSG